MDSDRISLCFELFEDNFFFILLSALETMGVGEEENSLGTDSTLLDFEVNVSRALYAKLFLFIGIKSASVIVHYSTARTGDLSPSSLLGFSSFSLYV